MVLPMASSEPQESLHLQYLRQALDLARQSPPKPTNYCVGAVIVDSSSNTVLSTGFTLELPGNTHAEQCCFAKLCEQQGLEEDQVYKALPAEGSAVIYTTMEPCTERLSGNLPCADRILKTRTSNYKGIGKVVVGISEPDTFVKANSARTKLENAGIEYIHVPGLEDDVLAVATAGHKKE